MAPPSHLLLFTYHYTIHALPPSATRLASPPSFPHTFHLHLPTDPQQVPLWCRHHRSCILPSVCLFVLLVTGPGRVYRIGSVTRPGRASLHQHNPELLMQNSGRQGRWPSIACNHGGAQSDKSSDFISGKKLPAMAAAGGKEARGLS